MASTSSGNTNLKMERQADSYCEQGKKLLQEGKYLLALEYFQAAVELDAEHVEGLFGQVCVFKALGKADKAGELQRQMDVAIQKKPSAKYKDLSSAGQLESARKRYFTLLKELVKVETDEFGLRHGCYSPESYKELAACESFIEALEQQLNLKRTNFKREREAMIAKKSSSPRRIKRFIRKRMSKYMRIAHRELRKTGRDNLGVNVYGYSQTTLEKLESIKNEVCRVEAYLPQNYRKNDFLEIRKRCVSERTKRAKRRVCRKAKRAYSRLIRHNLVRLKGQDRSFEVSSSIQAREKAMRSKIVALEPAEGNRWCNQEIAKQLKRRKDRPYRIYITLKIIGILLAIGVGLVVIYFVLKYLWYIIIGGVVLLAVIGFFSGD